MKTPPKPSGAIAHSYSFPQAWRLVEHARFDRVDEVAVVACLLSFGSP